MRLLKTDTLETQEFEYGNIPQYAILSHRWGKEEITLQDLENGVREKVGFRKVQQCCSRAKDDGFDYVWVDTCCINKTSSAELSEAINSMYIWYYQAERCYAYLADVPSKSTIEDSEWFTRGWTLQELLAPSEVYFVDEQWSDLGTKKDLQQVISSCTGIPINILSGDDDLETASIAQRMSWAAKRKTQRLEDRAYCLMGIYGINMPLLYGEGERAFMRLQQEIMRVSDDHSLFAWESPDIRGGLLATSPEAFKDSKDIIPFNHFNDPNDASTISSRGIHLGVRFMDIGPRGLGFAILPCKERNLENRPIAIYVRDLFGTMETFERIKSEKLVRLDLRDFRSSQYPMRKLCIQTGRMTPMRKSKDLGGNDNTAQYEIYNNKTLEKIMNFSDPIVLLRAAETGSQDDVWLLLTRADIEVGSKDEYGRTALSLAVIGGHEAIVKILLARGAKPDSSLHYGSGGYETLLMTAARKGYKGIVKLLLDNGAKVDSEDKAHHHAPLHLAVAGGHEDIVEQLLDRGADVDSEDIENRTPLLLAAGMGHGDIVNLLLDKGADVELKDADNWTPLLLATLRGHESVVKILLNRGAYVDSKDNKNQTSLSLAATGGLEVIVKLLLYFGADVNSRDTKNRTPLLLAAQYGHEGVVKILLERGADADTRDKYNRSLLSLATGFGNESAIRLLLQKSAEVDSKQV